MGAKRSGVIGPRVSTGAVSVLLALAVLALGACSSNEAPQDFPPYPPADDFLAYQRYLARERPPPPLEYHTARRDQAAYAVVQARQSAARRDYAAERQRQREAEARHWRAVDAEWRRMAARMERLRAAQAARQREMERQRSIVQRAEADARFYRQQAALARARAARRTVGGPEHAPPITDADRARYRAFLEFRNR